MKGLHKQFNVTAFFYEENGKNFRKYLNIKRINSEIISQKPDLMVIMMNPGSSKCLGKIDIESDAKPDRTQEKIMSVMLRCNLQYARVLNLSDYCEKKSNEFYKLIKNSNSNHSIFFDERKDDFASYYHHDIPLITAWGVNNNLLPLIEITLSKINKDYCFGIRKNNSKEFYYHPLVRNRHIEGKDWVEEVSSQIQNHLLRGGNAHL